ncbi:OpgC family protein [Oceanibium sediminis]|uniref:OpgC family protein n=1 Tax=Oceanibium sediminis TaxID=2026339 RepID=UPI000DD33F33|nr:OpgC domain-containing protein [Oceanibium sediminis]
MPQPVHPVRQRDPRLDFFRGTAMFIILLAHTPGNPWTLWIPARFGFSDATEIFVFCSGMASAIAFGRVFDRHGLPMGTLRIAHRVWQVYWSHIAMFFAVFAMVAALNASGLGTRDYVGQLNLYPFINNVPEQLIGLMTLTYVPNYFDILPMYLVILCMVPLMIALSRISPAAALGAMVLIWAFAQVQNLHDEGVASLGPLAQALSFLHLPAQYWFEPPNNTREWFFNPFAWQLVFFTGFAFMRGWIPAPPVRPWLIALALVVVLGNIPLANIGVRIWTLAPIEALDLPWAESWRAAVIEWRQEHRYLFTKTDQGILRYVQFLSLAYLAWAAAGPRGSRLGVGRAWGVLVRVIRKVGQQSLAVFVTSMVLARFMGFLLDIHAAGRDAPGKDAAVVLLVNLFGFAVIVATAYLVGWFKGEPWRKPPPEVAESPAPLSGAERAA